MATLPSIPDVFRVALNWLDSSGQKAVNVMHFKAPTLTAAAVLSQLDASVTTNMWFNVHSNASVVSLACTKLDQLSATVYLAVSGAKWTGAATSTDFIPQVAAIISLRTAKRGQRHRGRLFLPFQGELGTNAGLIATSAASSQTAWNTFLNAMVTGLATPVVASYGHSEYVKDHQIVTRTWTADSEPVTAFLVENLQGTQRRRQERNR